MRSISCFLFTNWKDQYKIHSHVVHVLEQYEVCTETEGVCLEKLVARSSLNETNKF